jgi:hypothetical protein
MLSGVDFYSGPAQNAGSFPVQKASRTRIAACRTGSLRERRDGPENTSSPTSASTTLNDKHCLPGFAVQRIVRDYGIDLFISTYDRMGDVENGEIRIQLKATDTPKWVRGGQAIAVRVDQGDFRHWLMEPMPVILAVYDAPKDTAYWLYVQAHFGRGTGGQFDKAGATMTVHVPRKNTVSPATMREFAGYRDQILAQLGGLTHDD